MSENSNVVVEISRPFLFSKNGISEIENNKWAKERWPVVYFIENKENKVGYIGESMNIVSRLNSHLLNKKKSELLCQVSIVGSRQFNKSATLDIESKLIEYVSSEGTYQLLNSNMGILKHSYYQKANYGKLFEKIWADLVKKGIVRKSIEDIENSQIFKYSPYKSLNDDQRKSIVEILKGLSSDYQLNEYSQLPARQIFIEGSAGTGKTILATYLMKLLTTELDEDDERDEVDEEIFYLKRFRLKYLNPRIGLVVAMTSLRETLRNVFAAIPGLSKSMIVSPSEVVNGEKYDLLIVDESHRLRKDKNIGWSGIFRENNRKLGLGSNGDELDWIRMCSGRQIFFYDKDQSVRPSDVDEQKFEALLNANDTLRLKLHSQMRVKGGVDYIQFVDKLLHQKLPYGSRYEAENYELVLFDSIRDFSKELASREEKFKLCRMIAGYSWPWLSKKDKVAVDIEIEGMKFQWNQVDRDWINSPTSVNEIGCIHTTQGYDLNYAGVIFGREIKYNPDKDEIEIDRKLYFDINGKKGVSNDADLKDYILNVYKNMMFRGIKGTFIYVHDDSLRQYLKQYIATFRKENEKIRSSIELRGERKRVPLLDIYAAAGRFTEAQLHEAHRWVEVLLEEQSVQDYFVCQVKGLSMNKKIPDGSYCLFKRYYGGTRDGQIVLAQSIRFNDSEFGAGYTVKKYTSKRTITEEGWTHDAIILESMSYDAGYLNITLEKEGTEQLSIIGIFVKVLSDSTEFEA